MDFHKLELTPLSSDDIYKICGCRNIIMYPNLSKYSDINDCFGDDDKFILFFELSAGGVGHWETCFRNNNVIYFFDSYGLQPDKCEDYINSNTRLTLNENKPYLTMLLNKAQDEGVKCIYSTQKYQLFDGAETCGRHCSIRLKNMSMNNEDYYNYLNSIKSKNGLKTFDDVVTQLTYSIINK